MNERFVHKPGCDSTTVGTPQHVHSRRPEGGVCQCWCHPTPLLHGTIGQPPHTGAKRGADCPECRAESFGPVTVITAEGTTTGYLTADDRIVVDPLDADMLERRTAETLLGAAGYKVTGGGIMVGGPKDGEWDVFIEDPDRAGADSERSFDNLAAVRAFIDKRAQEA
jgi:hypothetical protein